MRWLITAWQWAVLLPLWRRLIKNPDWHVPAAVFTGIAVFVGAIVIAFIALVALFPTESESQAEKDRRNEEVMASLPVYAGARLQHKLTWDDRQRVPGFPFNPLGDYRTLTHKYAIPDGANSRDVFDFYEQALVNVGWSRYDCDYFCGGSYTFAKEGFYVYIVLSGSDAVEVNVARWP